MVSVTKKEFPNSFFEGTGKRVIIGDVLYWRSLALYYKPNFYFPRGVFYITLGDDCIMTHFPTYIVLSFKKK